MNTANAGRKATGLWSGIGQALLVGALMILVALAMVGVHTIIARTRAGRGAETGPIPPG